MSGQPLSAARPSWAVWLSLALVTVVVLAAMTAALVPLLLPAGDPLESEGRALAAAVIFTGSYLALAIGRIPGLNIDRAGIALVGAGLMVAAGALPLAAAYQAVNLDTITLLLGMMIVVAHLKLSGFFALANGWIIGRARHPLALLVAVVLASGVFSAFLVNDAICLVLTPLVLAVTRAQGRQPAPYLLALAMASNVGSAATITGNPQNIMIGSFSGLSYSAFTARLGPVALIGLALTVLLIALRYRGRLTALAVGGQGARGLKVNRFLALRALAATLVLISLFFAGLAPAKAAIIIGGLLLLTRRVKTSRIYREIDWSLLLMFAGLFIIVAGAQHSLLSPEIITAVGRLHLDQVPMLTVVTAVLSNLVSNVPAVLVLKPFVEPLADPARAWAVVAMAATFAGNFTLLGSIANLIVVEKAAREGVVIGFWDYFKTGAPLTVLTLIVGVMWFA